MWKPLVAFVPVLLWWLWQSEALVDLKGAGACCNVSPGGRLFLEGSASAYAAELKWTMWAGLALNLLCVVIVVIIDALLRRSRARSAGVEPPGMVDVRSSRGGPSGRV